MLARPTFIVNLFSVFAAPFPPPPVPRTAGAFFTMRNGHSSPRHQAVHFLPQIPLAHCMLNLHFQHSIFNIQLSWFSPWF
jgi:hypothetical protein